jgi:hypothetical protein
LNQAINLLLIPYFANIAILVPVALGSLTGLLPISGGHFPESAGWRTITGSLWTGILVCSVAGLFHPTVFAPILVLQVIYKAVWLVFYVLPRLNNAETRQEIHWGIASSFTFIVILYPFVIPWRALFPQV